MIRTMAVLVALTVPVAGHAQQSPGWQQTLQGLMTGNQNQDNALRQAYQRGYQHGRDDEARATRSGGDRYRGDQDRGDQYGNSGPGPYGKQGYSGK